MAPLGVITAIVGAIRVAGPPWSKALIGRARETRGMAEIELLSSTSLEVSELWNGKAVVRIMGRPEILEVVYRKDGESTCTASHLHSVDEFHRLHFRNSKISLSGPQSVPHYKRDDGDSSSQSIDKLVVQLDPEALQHKVQRTHSDEILAALRQYAPNMSLNIASERTRIEIFFWAVFGLVVQGSVIAVDVWITRKNPGREDDIYPSWAMTLTLAGTLFLAVGMFICASVVEESTKEHYWGKPGECSKTDGLRILWLQRGRVVSDQQFNSYAIIARGTRRRILTSHPLLVENQSDEDRALSEKNEKNLRSMHPRRRLESHLSSYDIAILLEWGTVIGTIFSLVGIFIQFMGMRSSHWGVSLALLIATCVMTIVRAICRRGLTEAPCVEDLIKDHEMDWLATKMAGEPDQFWSHYSDGQTQQCFENPQKDLRRRWAIIPEECNEEYSHHWDEVGTRNLFKNSEIVEIRQKLGEMRNWTSPVTQQAIALATSVEAVLNTLFPNPSAQKMTTRFTWALKTLAANNDAYITVEFKKNGWKAQSAQIEAILSLWLYHIREQVESARHSSGSGQRGRKLLRKGSHKGHHASADWLRDGSESQFTHSFRMLCPNSKKICQLLDWWVPARAHASMIRCVTSTPNWNILQFDRKNSAHSDSSTAVPGSTETQYVESHFTFGDITQRAPYDCCREGKYRFDISSFDKQATGTHLALLSNTHPLPSLLAQHVFSTFMWEIAKSGKTKALDGAVTLSKNDPFDWKVFTLENTTLQKIVGSISQSGLMTEEEAYLYTVIPFGMKDKLPPLMSVVQLARKQARKQESREQWKEVTESYLWLFEKSKIFDPWSPVAVKSVIHLMQNYGFVRKMKKLHTDMIQDAFYFEALEHRILEKLKKVDMYIRREVAYVFLKIEHQLGDLELMSDDKGDKLELDEEERSMLLKNNLLQRQSAHVAVLRQRTLAKTRLLRHDINEGDLLERTALHYATALERVDFVMCLLQRGADPNCENSVGWTPFHLASWVGKEEIGRAMLQFGANFNSRAFDGTTPLHCAAKRNHAGFVKLLVDNGADLTAVDSFRLSPLHWAAFLGFKYIAKILLQAGAAYTARDSQGATPLHLTAIAGHAHIFKLLIERGSDLQCKTRNGASPLVFAARCGRSEVVNQILSLPDERRFVNVNAQTNEGMSALWWAVHEGQKETLDILMHDPDVSLHVADGNGDIFLSHCGHVGRWEIAKFVLDYFEKEDRSRNPHKNVDPNTPNKEGLSPLFWAVKNGDEATCREYTKRNFIKKNLKSQNGQTPLSWGAKLGRAGAVKALLWPDGEEAGPRVGDDILLNDICNTGFTALDWAVSCDRRDVTALLLQDPRIMPSLRDMNHILAARVLSWTDIILTPEHQSILKASVSSKKKSRCINITASDFIHAAIAGDLHTVKEHIESRSDVHTWINERDSQLKQTALVWATERRNTEIVQAILDVDAADVNAKNEFGDSALSIAAEMGFDDIVKMLLDKRQDVDVDTFDDAYHTPLFYAWCYKRTKIEEMLREKNAHLL